MALAILSDKKTSKVCFISVFYFYTLIVLKCLDLHFTERSAGRVEEKTRERRREPGRREAR